jgi:hypothetical protein
VLLDGELAGSGADAEEGEVVALGVGDEVAAGVGDPVDFVEGVGKVGNARRPHGFYCNLVVERAHQRRANLAT